MSKNTKIILIISIIIAILIIGSVIGFFVIRSFNNKDDNISKEERIADENSSDNNIENEKIKSKDSSVQNPVATMDVEYVDKNGDTKKGIIKIE